MLSALPESFAGFAGQFLDLVCAEQLTVYVFAPGDHRLEVWYASADNAPASPVPVSGDSIAGYVARFRRTVRIDDATDDETLSSVYPDLNWTPAHSAATGLVVRAALACPVEMAGRLVGVVEIINCRRSPNGSRFSDQDLAAMRQLAESVAPVLAPLAEEEPERIPDEPVRPPEDGNTGPADTWPPELPDPFHTLVERGVIASETLTYFQRISRTARMSVGRLLITNAGIGIEEIGSCLREYYNVPFVSYDPALAVDGALLDELNRKFLVRRRWVPLSKKEKKAVVLIDDPFDHSRIHEIETVLGVSECEIRVALLEDILRFIDPIKYGDWSSTKSDQEIRLEELVGDLSEDELLDISNRDNVTELLTDDASKVVQIVSRLIADAIRQGASDIHIEPGWGAAQGRARIRIDGVCHEMFALPNSYMASIISRIKIMANLDITEKRVPQDGKMTVRLSDKRFELRVATVPTVLGENAVLRILARRGVLNMGQLGLSSANLRRIEELVQRPYGIFLVVGPTGSGKTTTLHALLSHVNTPEKKIWTVEDPVEITQAGLQQLQVNRKANVTFATALRAFLRADPDIILVGEMRDLETARTGIEASLTGHLVFSTLHTNSAPDTLTRLLDIGIDPISFSDALIGVLAQRLVRKLCPGCREAYIASEKDTEKLLAAYGPGLFTDLNVRRRNVELYRAVGCDQCRGTGYLGRLAIHELLVGSPAIKTMIVQRESGARLHDAAVDEGMRTLRQDGIAKVFRGETDIQQIWMATVQ